MKTIYLCGPINGRSDSDCTDWRETVKAAWHGECLDPMRHDYRGREQEPGIAAKIVAQDTEDLRATDALLVYFDKPSVGTSMEVLLAHQMRKPVVVVNASGKPLSPWLSHHATSVCESVGDALLTLGGLA
jgi:nucleoside 2-deoxyribosyltransferase